MCREEGAALYTDCKSREVPAKGQVVKQFTLLEPVLDCDMIINLPKLKTHMMTGLSAATKNLFGCIPGLQKAEWHMRFPDKERFGGMLVDLLCTVKPGFAILDGILAQEGDGPAGGTPRMVGIVAVAEDHLQMDLALCRMLGIRPKDVPYLNAGHQPGLVPGTIRPGLRQRGRGAVPPHSRLPAALQLGQRGFCRQGPPRRALGGARGGAAACAPPGDQQKPVHRLRQVRRDLPPAHHHGAGQGAHSRGQMYPVLLLPRDVPGEGHRYPAIFPFKKIVTRCEP